MSRQVYLTRSGLWSIDTSPQGVLGEGGHGKVYRGRNMDTNELVAVKVTPRNRAAWEVGILRMLHHHNIVRLYGSENDGENTFLFLELCRGGELFDLVATSTLIEESLSSNLFAQLCKALQHCHSLGIAHADVKPENLLLTHTGQLKLADFGIALVQKRDAHGRVALTSSTLGGSQLYSAPEKFIPEAYDAFASDMWSAGVVLFCMLTGTYPFSEATSRCDVFVTMQRSGIEAVLEIKHVAPTPVPRLAIDLLSRLLVVKPSGRLTATAALDHPWVRMFAASRSRGASAPEAPALSAPSSTQSQTQSLSSTPMGSDRDSRTHSEGASSLASTCVTVSTTSTPSTPMDAWSEYELRMDNITITSDMAAIPDAEMLRRRTDTATTSASKAPHSVVSPSPSTTPRSVAFQAGPQAPPSAESPASASASPTQIASSQSYPPAHTASASAAAAGPETPAPGAMYPLKIARRDKAPAFTSGGVAVPRKLRSRNIPTAGLPPLRASADVKKLGWATSDKCPAAPLEALTQLYNALCALQTREAANVRWEMCPDDFQIVGHVVTGKAEGDSGATAAESKDAAVQPEAKDALASTPMQGPYLPALQPAVATGQQRIAVSLFRLASSPIATFLSPRTGERSVSDESSAAGSPRCAPAAAYRIQVERLGMDTFQFHALYRAIQQSFYVQQLIIRNW